MKEEFTKLSSKGQVVIPRSVRKELGLKEGTPFVVIARKDSILLKKMEKPKIKSWDEATKPFRSAVKKSKFTKEHLNKLIEETRRARHA